MSSILDISISGLNAASARIANSASNIVNASSISSLPKNANDPLNNFNPQNVVTISNSTGGNNLGVSTAQQPRSPSYVTAYDPNSSQANAEGLVAAPNVDLASEAVTIASAKADYGANAAVIRIANKVEKSLLDITT